MENRGSPVASAPAFAIMLGLCCSVFLNSIGLPAIAALSAGVLIPCSWMLLGSSRITPGWMQVFFIILVLSALLSLISQYRIEKKITLPSSVETTGQVLINRSWGKKRAILISTHYGKFASYCQDIDAPPEGSEVKVRGALFDFKKTDKRSGFDEFLFWRAKGAIKKLIILDIKIIAKPNGIYIWRNYLTERIINALPERMAGYMLALTVGARDEKLSELHRNAGTIHLLSVSGFHVGIMALFASMMFRRGLRKIIGVSVIIWLYILLAGAPVGGIRAALMLQIYLLGLLIGRPSNGFNSVSVAGIVLLMLNPWSFFDIGWRLSMVAALFLSAVGPVMRRSWIYAAAASTIVWFVTAPQIAAVFREVPIAGLLINTIAIPLFSLIFPVVFLFSLPSLLGLPFGWIIAETGEYMLQAWEILSELTVSLVPWSIEYTLPLLMLSAVLFATAAAYASDISKDKIPFIAALFSIFLLLSA